MENVGMGRGGSVSSYYVADAGGKLVPPAPHSRTLPESHCTHRPRVGGLPPRTFFVSLP